MIIIPPPKQYPRKRGAEKRKAAAPAPPVAALTLVAATYAEGESVTLEFDRAVDVAAFVPGAVTVDDAIGTGWAYVGTGAASQPTPASVVVTLAQNGPAAEGETRLSATAGTGIVADAPPVGGTWAGVTDLELPWP